MQVIAAEVHHSNDSDIELIKDDHDGKRKRGRGDHKYSKSLNDIIPESPDECKITDTWSAQQTESSGINIILKKDACKNYVIVYEEVNPDNSSISEDDLLDVKNPKRSKIMS